MVEKEYLTLIPKNTWVKLHISMTDTVLDVGIAEGHMWENAYFQITGLDMEPKFKPDIVGRAEALPVKDKSFDIVCLCEILEHVKNPNIILMEAVRVARLKVIITVPWEHLWSAEFAPFNNKMHVRFYTASSLRKELREIGLPFQIIPIGYKDEGGLMAWIGAEIYSCAGGLRC